MESDTHTLEKVSFTSDKSSLHIMLTRNAIGWNLYITVNYGSFTITGTSVNTDEIDLLITMLSEARHRIITGRELN